jgi:hypothetical protein
VGWEANSVDSADDDGFLASVDLNTAADTVSMSDQSNMPGFGKKFSIGGGDTQISITMTQATTATSGSIKLAVFYSVD